VRLVSDILSFERLESGKVQLEPEACQVTSLMYKAINSVQPLADHSGITIALTPLNVTLWAAPDAIIQVLTNLLSNAIKFSCPGGTIWLKAEERMSERTGSDDTLPTHLSTHPPTHPSTPTSSSPSAIKAAASPPTSKSAFSSSFSRSMRLIRVTTAAPGWAWPSASALCSSTGVTVGSRARWAGAALSPWRCP
jgi:hypothetical protein